MPKSQNISRLLLPRRKRGTSLRPLSFRFSSETTMLTRRRSSTQLSFFITQSRDNSKSASLESSTIWSRPRLSSWTPLIWTRSQDSPRTPRRSRNGPGNLTFFWSLSLSSSSSPRPLVSWSMSSVDSQSSSTTLSPSSPRWQTSSRPSDSELRRDPGWPPPSDWRSKPQKS